MRLRVNDMTHDYEHDHEREHEHDHERANHAHGHSHEHDHEQHHGYRETVETNWGRIEMEAHVHDDAATVSMDAHPKEGCAVTISSLVDSMQRIAQAAEGTGGIVGHIKCFAQQGAESAHASVTAADLAPTVEGDDSLSFGSMSTIQLVAIILLISQDDLLAICKDAIAS